MASNYKALVSREGAEKYWNNRPDAPDNVVPMDAAAWVEMTFRASVIQEFSDPKARH
jgi:hypothetical protein